MSFGHCVRFFSLSLISLVFRPPMIKVILIRHRELVFVGFPLSLCLSLSVSNSSVCVSNSKPYAEGVSYLFLPPGKQQHTHHRPLYYSFCVSFALMSLAWMYNGLLNKVIRESAREQFVCMCWYIYYYYYPDNYKSAREDFVSFSSISFSLSLSQCLSIYLSGSVLKYKYI